MLLIDGRPADAIDARDRGLHYGDGLFETVAVHDGRPELWAKHIERLGRGCERLGIRAPEAGLLYEELRRVVPATGRCVAKLIVTRGSGGRGYRLPVPQRPRRLVMAAPWPDYPESYRTEGVAVRLCRTRLGLNPQLAGLKHLNRLEQVMARREWDTEYAEGLMLDPDGGVVEGTSSNVFLVEGGDRLATPELSRCGVAGVMRAAVIESARSLGVAVEERRIRPAELRDAEGLFLTNALVRIWPVREFEGVHCRRPSLLTKLYPELERYLGESGA